MIFADVSFSTEGLAIIAGLLACLTGAVTVLHRALIAAKDAQIAAKASQNASLNEMASEAITNLEIAAAKHLAASGKVPPLPLVPVVPEHNSPTTEKQRIDAERETLRARLTAAALQLDLPARRAAPMEDDDLATDTDRILGKLDDIKKTQNEDKARELLKQIAPVPQEVKIIDTAKPIQVEIQEKGDKP